MYGYKAVVLDSEALEHIETIQILNSLKDYPCLDEEKYSEMMNKAFWNGWEDYASDDFVKELNKHLKLEKENPKMFEVLENLDIETTADIFHIYTDMNEGFIDQPSGVYIKTSEIAKKIDKESLIQILEYEESKCTNKNQNSSI